MQIESAPHLPRSTPARVVMGPVAGGFRSLRIQIGSRRGGDALLALLGHELFHVVEIAHAREVHDEETMAALYRRIGFRAGSRHQYDTHDAHIIESLIERELGRRGSG